MNRKTLNAACILGVTALAGMAAVLMSRENRRSRRKRRFKPRLERKNIASPGALQIEHPQQVVQMVHPQQTVHIQQMVHQELSPEDLAAIQNYLPMDRMQFEHILGLIRPSIEKQDTIMREAISAQTRLLVALRFLATGESFRSLMKSTGIHETSIGKIVVEVCTAIYNTLKEQYLKMPNTEEEWTTVARGFQEICQFPNCIGALDGRHIKFGRPMTDGYKCKREHSIVLLALADARYSFTYVNVDMHDQDGGVFSRSGLNVALLNGSLKLPQAQVLPGRDVKVPFVMVADDAFPFANRIMKPFPLRNLPEDRRIFNYRLSQARRMVERSFGILVNRFRVLMKPLQIGVKKIEIVILACVVLHNYLVEHSPCYIDFDDAHDWQLPKMDKIPHDKGTATAKLIREEFMNYFVSNEKVDEAI